MARMPWALYLWPGLPHLWIRGGWLGLAVAFGFACAVNLMLIGDVVWGEPLAPAVRTIGWGAIAVVWAVSAVFGCWWERRHRIRCGSTDRNDVFDEALSHYLQGNWFEVECMLGDLLRRNIKDVEARLMLATLLRHTERFDEAGSQLDRLERSEGTDAWKFEIDRERQLLAEAVQKNLEDLEDEAIEPQVTGIDDDTTDDVSHVA